MVNGLHALHTKKIVHRDIKCANVFLTKDGIVKLGDLNVSKIAKAGIMQTQTGTPTHKDTTNSAVTDITNQHNCPSVERSVRITLLLPTVIKRDFPSSRRSWFDVTSTAIRANESFING